jgi:hypothetical protein
MLGFLAAVLVGCGSAYESERGDREHGAMKI